MQMKNVARPSGALAARVRRKAADVCGFRSLRVRGDYGVIEDAIWDRAILQTYARRKVWTPVKNGLVQEFFAAAGGGTYLDIGANIGLTTIPIARNPRVKCVAFEPEPRNFGYLRTNVARNCPHRNVELHHLALLDGRGTAAFELSRKNSGDHGVLGNDAPFGASAAQQASIRVPTARLDEIVAPEALTPPLAVKLVAQGAEAKIIAGGELALRRAELMILLFYPYGLARVGGDPVDLCRFMTGQFRSGALWRGEAEHKPDWLPIGAVADKASDLVTHSARSPTDYLFLALRQSPPGAI